MSLRSVSILRYRTLVMALFSAWQIALAVPEIVFAQPLPAEPLPAEVQAVVEKAIQDADKKRIETFKKMMEAAIKKETDLGLKQRLERERDATIREWLPPAPVPAPALAPQPADAALLADLRKILSTKQIKVNGGVVTLGYDFRLKGAQIVAAKDFDLPKGVDFNAIGIQIPAQDEVTLRAKLLRLKRVNASLFHQNWGGDWLKVGDAFECHATRGNHWVVRMTNTANFTQFTGPKPGDAPILRTLDLLFTDKKTDLTFDTWNPGGGPQPVILASDLVLPQNPGPVRLMGGSAGALYSTLIVEGEIDPGWVQAEIARLRP